MTDGKEMDMCSVYMWEGYSQWFLGLVVGMELFLVFSFLGGLLICFFFCFFGERARDVRFSGSARGRKGGAELGENHKMNKEE